MSDRSSHGQVHNVAWYFEEQAGEEEFCKGAIAGVRAALQGMPLAQAGIHLPPSVVRESGVVTAIPANVPGAVWLSG